MVVEKPGSLLLVPLEHDVSAKIQVLWLCSETEANIVKAPDDTFKKGNEVFVTVNVPFWALLSPHLVKTD